MNEKVLRKDNHSFLLYLLVSDFSINFEKKKFDSNHLYWFFIPYTRGVARADFLLGAVGAAILVRFR